MYVIVGLGNKGKTYVGTRHNAGRMALEAWVVSRDGSFVTSSKYASRAWEGVVGTEKVLALLPETFMNESGGAVKKAVPSKKQAEQLVVLYDDIDLPLGTVRVSYNRGAGGHNGIKSVIGSLKTEAFTRVRIGISPLVRGKAKKPKDADAVLAWVMGEFKKSEQKTFTDVSLRVGEIIEHTLKYGVQATMNKFNGL